MKPGRKHSFSHLALFLPTAVSALASVRNSALLFAFSLALAFALVALVPTFRRNESLWMFLIVVLASIPLNIVLLRNPFLTTLLADDPLIVRILRVTVLYCILLSVEEIVIGVAARVIWRRQCQLFSEEGD